MTGGARKVKHEGSVEDVRANDLVLRKWGKPSTIPAGLQMLFEPFTASSLSSVAVTCRDALSAITPKQFFQLQMRFTMFYPHAVSLLLLLTQNPACLSS